MKKIFYSLLLALSAFSYSVAGEAPKLPGVSFEATELVFSAHGVDKIVGTLWTPTDRPKPFPLAVWVHGSGPALKGDLGPYRDLLVKAGLAVFSWDKPGVGASGGKFSDYPLENHREEVRAALSLSRKRSEIDMAHIGLIGISQAGVIMTPVAAEDSGISFLVALSPLTLPFSDRYQLETGGFKEVLLQYGISKEGAEAAERLEQVTFFGVIERNGPAEEIRKAARVFQAEHGSEPAVSRLVKTGWLPFADPAQYTDELHADFSVILHSDMRPTIAKLRCPALYLFGSADKLVNPNTTSVGGQGAAGRQQPGSYRNRVPGSESRFVCPKFRRREVHFCAGLRRDTNLLARKANASSGASKVIS